MFYRLEKHFSLVVDPYYLIINSCINLSLKFSLSIRNYLSAKLSLYAHMISIIIQFVIHLFHNSNIL